MSVINLGLHLESEKPCKCAFRLIGETLFQDAHITGARIVSSAKGKNIILIGDDFLLTSQ